MTIKKYNLIKIIIKILASLIFLTFLINTSFAIQELCGNKSGEDKYDCQVKNFCEEYKTEDIHYKTEDFFKSTNDTQVRLFNNAKVIYRENQNGIYYCAIIKVQKNSLDLIKEKLSKIDKTGTLKSIIDKKISTKINKLENASREKECKFATNKIEDKNPIYFKQKLLQESAYQYCQYSYYLDFLKNHFKNIENANKEFITENEKSSYKTTEIASIQNKLQQDILDEEEHSGKVFSMAFSSYIDYESNYPVHFLLELIKEDYIVFRRKLHEAISPLNQVVYKISNAMSIH